MVQFDSQNNALSSRSFDGSLLSKVVIPACDGSSKAPSHLELTIAASRVRYEDGGARAPTTKTSTLASKWLASNFRVRIDGLPTSRIRRVGPITWTRRISTGTVGAFRDAAVSAGAAEVKPFTIEVSQADRRDWQSWFREFVLQGKTGSANRKRASVEFLAADLVTVLATLELEAVGIRSLRAAKTPTGLEVGLFANRLVLKK